MDLFIGQGYAATTLEQVATRAEVAVQTVYFHFGNKRTVLSAAIDVLVVGDDDPMAMIDRPQARAALAATDPAQAIGTWVGNAQTIFERVAPLLGILRDAVGADPDLAQEWQINRKQRLADHRTFATHLATIGALAPGMSTTRATDIIYALLAPEMYALLTSERAWSPGEWSAWATAMLTRALL
jgi:Bacterial regulatory proteins, tetR family.